MMILGLVSRMQPVHGYDVRRELLSWSADEWANVAPGSIYHALKKLAEEDMLAEVATEQVGTRPARTTYRITPKGEAEFQELLRRYWWELDQPIDPFLSAMGFLPALPRDEAVAALHNRARLLRTAVEGLRASVDSDWMRKSKPAHVTWMLERSIALMEAEIPWCERVADLVESKVPGVPDSPFDRNDEGAAPDGSDPDDAAR
jgi:DNA-binding PadR family transcriptional regulator